MKPVAHSSSSRFYESLKNNKHERYTRTWNFKLRSLDLSITSPCTCVYVRVTSSFHISHEPAEPGSDHLHNRKKQQLHNNRHILSRRLARRLARSLARLVFTSVSIEAERYGPRFFSPRARHFIFKQWRVKLGIKLQENYASLLTSASTSLNFSFCARRALSPPAFFGTFVKASFLDEITSNASARP